MLDTGKKYFQGMMKEIGQKTLCERSKQQYERS